MTFLFSGEKTLMKFEIGLLKLMMMNGTSAKILQRGSENLDVVLNAWKETLIVFLYKGNLYIYISDCRN